MKIFVVIPNWNEADLLKSCLLSLKKQSIEHKVVVVDNGSSDHSLKIINNFPNVYVIKNKKNMGFTGGVNPGIKYALEQNAEYIALLNNDAVVDSNWLKELLFVMKSNQEVGIVTSKIMLNDKKHLDGTGDFYSIYGIPFPRGRNQIDSKQFNNELVVFGASGGASLYRASIFKNIGVFDHRFFAYYEDVDISFRAQLAGWKIQYQPNAICYHHIGITSSKMGDFSRYHSIKNFLILYTKDMPARLYFKYLPKFLYQLCRTFVRSVLDGQLLVFIKAIGKFIILLPSILRDRQKIQRSRSVSVDYIDSMLHKNKPEKIPEISF